MGGGNLPKAYSNFCMCYEPRAGERFTNSLKNAHGNHQKSVGTWKVSVTVIPPLVFLHSHWHIVASGQWFPSLMIHTARFRGGRGNYQERTFGMARSASIQSTRKLPASVDADCGVLMRLHLRLSKLVAAKPTATINPVAWAPWPRRRERSNPWE